MTPKRIFIISTYPMFSYGLESLLSQENGLEIVGQEANIDTAVEQIKDRRPNVVILDSDEPTGRVVSNMLDQIAQENLETKVIGLSLRTNKIHIYRTTKQVVTGVNDLLAAILHDSSAANSANQNKGKTNDSL